MSLIELHHQTNSIAKTNVKDRSYSGLPIFSFDALRMDKKATYTSCI